MNSLPTSDQEIHPFMPIRLHDGLDRGGIGISFKSPLGKTCEAFGVSVHDREFVYELLKTVRKNLP